MSERIARKIVSNCTSKEKDIEGCVASRVVGLQYIEDIMKELPDKHPLKIDDRQCQK